MPARRRKRKKARAPVPAGPLSEPLPRRGGRENLPWERLARSPRGERRRIAAVHRRNVRVSARGPALRGRGGGPEASVLTGPPGSVLPAAGPAGLSVGPLVIDRRPSRSRSGSVGGGRGQPGLGRPGGTLPDPGRPPKAARNRSRIRPGLPRERRDRGRMRALPKRGEISSRSECLEREGSESGSALLQPWEIQLADLVCLKIVSPINPPVPIYKTGSR